MERSWMVATTLQVKILGQVFGVERLNGGAAARRNFLGWGRADDRVLAIPRD